MQLGDEEVQLLRTDMVELKRPGRWSSHSPARPRMHLRRKRLVFWRMNMFVEFVLPVFSFDHRVSVTQSVCDGTDRRRSTVVNKVTAVWYCARLENFLSLCASWKGF